VSFQPYIGLLRPLVTVTISQN